MTVHNPYWEEIAPHVRQSELAWEGLQVDRYQMLDRIAQRDDPFKPLDIEKWIDRNSYVGKYSWTIPDPDALRFVVKFTKGGMVDPMAGTGYWAYLLKQWDVDVVCYDISPGEDNTWHQDADLWVPVEKMDGAEATAKHPDRTLMLAWPPYSQDVGARILAAYHGERVIYMGESNGGCTGDSGLHEALDEDWTEIAACRPVQWYGLHDDISVYERRLPGKELAMAGAASCGLASDPSAP